MFKPLGFIVLKKLITATCLSLPFISLSFKLIAEQESLKSHAWQWEYVEAVGKPVARHEAGLFAIKEHLYLIGGRRINPTSVFNTNTHEWKNLSHTPIEIHHFQPVVYKGKVYIIGALTGQWPHETPVDSVIIYTPETDSYEYGDKIPKHRLRGGVGAVVHRGKIYLVGGITDGHMQGYVPWFDEYNPETGQWKVLTDAPSARDHFQLTSINNKIYAFAGRKTSKATNQDIDLTIVRGDVFNFTTGKWEQSNDAINIPTARAGNGAFSWQNYVVIGGGESGTQTLAHNEIEAFNTKTQQWSTWPALLSGRHGSGFAVIGDYVYTASGSGKQGGGPELITVERLKLPNK